MNNDETGLDFFFTLMRELQTRKGNGLRIHHDASRQHASGLNNSLHLATHAVKIRGLLLPLSRVPIMLAPRQQGARTRRPCPRPRPVP